MRTAIVIGLLLCATLANSQCFRVNTDSLNVRSCAGTNCGVVGSVTQGQTVNLVNNDAPQANGHTWAQIGNGRWVSRTYLVPCGGGGSPPAPPAGNGGASSNLGGYPTSYATSGYTYTGRRAQVLHFLKARFTASATTYASHSDGALSSSDLWTTGAAYSKDNSGVPAMNQLAEYCAANLGSLGLKYVIWRQRINTGSGWRGMENRGSITQNHMDHVHITFQGGFNAALDSASDTYTASTDAIPGWAIGIIVLNIVVVAALGALVVVVIRWKASREIRE